ncbi:hypothetical protein H4N58_12445 [Mumia sp. ZJ1417]|uniref:hypothetical protein n=1 Tax=unclassified Mumia TaxID=2621872 RepID=UPI00141D8A62|nr:MULTISPECIES: hypothetical protein [unclassified Mumia]QMW65031.1 hypothetical protein H4N58_12445 [Mumia sp. ZJ1417]
MRVLAVGMAASALVVGAAASPAAAKTRGFSDTRGDATSALDITKVKVANKKHAVVVRLSVPGLKNSQLGLVSVTVKPRHRPMFAVTRARFDGRWHRASLVRRDVGAVVRCRGDQVAFGRRSITVRIPHRCLGGSNTAVRVRAEVVEREDELTRGPAPASAAVLGGSDTFPDARHGLSAWVRRG